MSGGRSIYKVTPALGQTWSLIQYGSQRYTMRIDEIDPPGKYARARGPMIRNGSDGKQTDVLVSVLAKGLRGARCERYADGTTPFRPPETPIKFPPKEETAKASDYLKTTLPKGLVTARPQDLEVMRLRKEEHLTIKEVAVRMGFSVHTVQQCCDRVRQAEEDARFLKAGGT